MQTWAWCGSGAECYCGLCEKKGDFVPLARPSIIAHMERNVLRLYLWRQRCCGGHLVTQEQWPAVPADCTPCCSPGVQHHVSGAGWHLGEGCLKDVGVEGQGQQVSKVFHPGAFQILLQQRTGAHVVGTIQISSVEQERGHFTMRCGSQGLLLCVKNTGPSRCCEDTSPQVFCFWEAQALTRPLCGVHPLASTSLWSPAQHCESTGSSSETCQCFTGSSAKPILEHFLKEISSALIRAKGFLANPTPLTSKLERDCPSHCFREQEALGGSCCLSSNFSEEQNGAVVPSYKEVMNFKRVKQLLGGETQGAEDWKLDNFPSLA